jgi:DNA-binding response OmpR family regulator
MPGGAALRRILVVDDDPDLSELVVAALTCQGFAAIVARNGHEALDLLATGLRPAAILLDLVMPVMDGREFRTRQREQANIATIPVIICSAEAPSTAADLAAYATFTKPLDLDALIDLLRSM